MWKAIKPVIGLALLVSFGLFYGKFQNAVEEVSEPKMYSLISIEYPIGVSKIALLKETPASKCEKFRKEYFEESIGRCSDCKVLHNECRSGVPKEYSGVFRKVKIDVSYIYKPYKYPEVTIPEGMPEGAFSKICGLEVSQFEKSICIE